MDKAWFEISLAEREMLARRCERVPIIALHLSPRLHNALLRADQAMTVADLLRAEEDVARIRGIGEGSLSELSDRLLEILAYFPEQIEGWIERETPRPEIPPATLSERIPERLYLLGIEQLHIGRRCYNALKRAGLITVGHLLTTTSQATPQVAGIGYHGWCDVRDSLECLRQAITSEDDVDWLQYCRLKNVRVIPPHYDAGIPFGDIVDQFPRVLKMMLVLDEEDTAERSWIIIERRFRFSNSDRLTLDDIGAGFGGLTRERIRQLEARALQSVKEAIVDQNYAGRTYHVHPEVSEAIRRLYRGLQQAAHEWTHEIELRKRISRELGVNPVRIQPTVNFLLVLSGATRLNFGHPHLDPAWLYASDADLAVLKVGVERLDEILTAEQVLPVTEFDTLRLMNRGADRSGKLTSVGLRQLVRLCSSAETLEGGLLRGRFECLQGRGNQAERLLFEADAAMSLRAMVREINHRLVPLGQKKLNVVNLRNQLSNDQRFAPIGNSGEWGLKAWDHLETGRIIDLIERYLTERNEPASVEDIYAYVAARRPVTRSSVQVYLSTRSEFACPEKDRWGLTAWAKVRSKRQRGGSAGTAEKIVRSLLNAVPDKTMAQTELVKKLKVEMGCAEATAYNYITNLAFVRRIRVEGSRRVACQMIDEPLLLAFPRVAQIHDSELRAKIERCIPYLSLESVDVALFLLSKEFEATLKRYLIAAQATGQLDFPPSKGPARWRLIDMIDAVERSGILTDKGVLQLLRAERNERAHGTMPSLAERQILHQNAQYLAGLYIDYIALFDDLCLKLKP